MRGKEPLARKRYRKGINEAEVLALNCHALEGSGIPFKSEGSPDLRLSKSSLGERDPLVPIELAYGRKNTRSKEVLELGYGEGAPGAGGRGAKSATREAGASRPGACPVVIQRLARLLFDL